jgi:anti-sigma B factor antagonist
VATSELSWEDRDDGRWVFLRGELDYMGCEELGERFDSVVQEAAGKVVVELSGVKFMGSQGIRLLLNARRSQKDKEQDLHVTGLTPGLKRLFKTTGLDRVIAEVET